MPAASRRQSDRYKCVVASMSPLCRSRCGLSGAVGSEQYSDRHASRARLGVVVKKRSSELRPEHPQPPSCPREVAGTMGSGTLWREEQSGAPVRAGLRADREGPVHPRTPPPWPNSAVPAAAPAQGGVELQNRPEHAARRHRRSGCPRELSRVAAGRARDRVPLRARQRWRRSHDLE